MSAVSEVSRLIELTKRLSPKCAQSRLWKRSARLALREALAADTAADYNGEAREGSPEDEEWQDKDGEPMFGEIDTRNTLTELLGRPPRGT